VAADLQRVALVSPYALAVHGGAQEQVLAMSRQLTGRGATVLVVSPRSGDDDRFDTPAEVLAVGSVTSTPANGSRAPITLSPFAARTVASRIEEFGPEVVHFHEPFAPLIGYWTLRAHRFPAVGTFHRSGAGPAYSLTRPLLTRLARGLDVAAAVSPAAARTIGDEVGVQAEVLFNGFETDRLREFPREHAARPLVLFVGRLEDRKGVLTLIEAARRHADRSWRLAVAGDGPLRAHVERAAEGLSDVEVLGPVDDATKRHLLRQADVLAAPSVGGESFGLVLIEAMAAETRVVAGDIDGYREAAAGHAVLCRPRDPDALATAIDEALRTRDVDTIEAARQHADGWSMSALVDRYEEIYRRAIERFRGGR
jgi:phosphatidylinositol alpha-mannosyltransferase